PTQSGRASAPLAGRVPGATASHGVDLPRPTLDSGAKRSGALGELSSESPPRTSTQSRLRSREGEAPAEPHTAKTPAQQEPRPPKNPRSLFRMGEGEAPAEPPTAETPARQAPRPPKNPPSGTEASNKAKPASRRADEFEWVART